MRRGSGGPVSASIRGDGGLVGFFLPATGPPNLILPRRWPQEPNIANERSNIADDSVSMSLTSALPMMDDSNDHMIVFRGRRLVDEVMSDGDGSDDRADGYGENGDAHYGVDGALPRANTNAKGQWTQVRPLNICRAAEHGHYRWQR